MKNGKWICTKYRDDLRAKNFKGYTCSKCEKEFDKDYFDAYDMKYCPNCGAKMDLFDESTMTVRELKALLNKYPDTFKVNLGITESRKGCCGTVHGIIAHSKIEDSFCEELKETLWLCGDKLSKEKY